MISIDIHAYMLYPRIGRSNNFIKPFSLEVSIKVKRRNFRRKVVFLSTFKVSKPMLSQTVGATIYVLELLIVILVHREYIATHEAGKHVYAQFRQFGRGTPE